MRILVMQTQFSLTSYGLWTTNTLGGTRKSSELKIHLLQPSPASRVSEVPEYMVMKQEGWSSCNTWLAAGRRWPAALRVGGLNWKHTQSIGRGGQRWVTGSRRQAATTRSLRLFPSEWPAARVLCLC